jgi:hypothetical protein
MKQRQQLRQVEERNNVEFKQFGRDRLKFFEL